jgi:signal transduction histidine kinase
VIVPLLVHGRTLGALGLYAGTPRRYGTEDLLFAQEVARRAALAVENARLYQLTQKLHTAAVQHTEELQRINAEFQQFSYIVAHDLTEPLRTMRNFIGLLAQRLKGQPGAATEEYMALVTDAAQRLQQMLTDLLAYTRAGQTPEFTAVWSANPCWRRCSVPCRRRSPSEARSSLTIPYPGSEAMPRA